MGGASHDFVVTTDDWDEAPCGLLILDEHDRVRAANAGFLRRTGYDRRDVIAKAFWNELLATGSRVFYQTQLAPVLELDGVLDEVMVDLRTADSRRVPALLNARRISDDTGRRLATRIALMGVPDRRVYENELRRARDEAEQARREADRARSVDAVARRRLEFQGSANTALAGSSDVTTALTRVTRVLVENFADWCVTYALEPDDPEIVRWTSAHADPAQQDLLARLAGLPSGEAGPQSALRRVMASGQPVLLAETGQQDRHDAADGLELLATFAALGVGSALIVPCHARAAGVATIIAVRQPGRAPFTPDDLMDLTDLAARAGMVIDTLRRNAREHNNSVALQQALLTAPPQTPGLQIVTRYLPATSGNEIGGDWYDAYVQPDRTPMLVIGDVVGHDIHAAASMGHLRGLIRTVGYTTGGTPADILSQSDAAARGLGVAVLATAVIACVQNLDAGGARLQWTNAGHPPPILITRHGPRLLDAAPDRPLGMGAKLARPRHNHVVPLERGDTVLLYTDGLIERVDEDLDAVIAGLMTALDHARSAELGELCDHVLAERGDGTTDDIALLAVRLHDAGPSSSLLPTVS